MLEYSPAAAPARGDTASATSKSSDLLWGADEIGRAINRNPRQVWHLLDRGEIKCAVKKGGRWVASRAALLREFGGADR
jgi:hypothetical protein